MGAKVIKYCLPKDGFLRLLIFYFKQNIFSLEDKNAVLVE
jgi:hypothetical protein